MKFRFIEAWGYGTALFLSEIYPVLNVNGLSAYHSSGVTASNLKAALVGIVLGALVFLAALAIPAKGNWRLAKVSLVCMLTLPVFLANRFAMVFVARRLWEKLTHVPRQAYFYAVPVHRVVLVFFVALLLVLAIAYWWPKLFRGLVAFANIAMLALALLGCVAAVNIVRAVYIHRHDHDFVAMHHRTPEEDAERPRVVWIIFDELSYDKVYEHRASGLALPNFDKLAGMSDVYTQVQPVAYFTDQAVPALLYGRQINDIYYSFSTGLRFRFADTQKYEGLDSSKLLPAVAGANGWNVGISGWWNPYCLLMAGHLQSCKWTWREGWTDRQMRGRVGVRGHLAQWAYGLYHNEPGERILRVRLEEEHSLKRWGDDLINNPDMDFVFIHLTPPHGPFPYDRRTGQETTQPGSSYLDGLAHADRELGDLIQNLEASPRWKNTTLVVNGDHSWRMGIYKFEQIWTPEDEAVSHSATFDERPFLTVHHPGQTAERQIAEPTPLLHVHDIIQSIVTTPIDAGGK
jgi:hypothetical protein